MGNIINENSCAYAGAGGILGSSTNNVVYISNCYNTGNVKGQKDRNNLLYEGAIQGCFWYNTYKSVIKNTYYKKGSCKFAINSKNIEGIETYEKEDNYLKSKEFLEKLNEFVKTYNEENKDDSTVIELRNWKTGENGYPTFE